MKALLGVFLTGGVLASHLLGCDAILVLEDADPTQLVQTLLDPKIIATNITFTGNSNCTKIFSNAREMVRGQPFPDSGVVLSTGLARSLVNQTGGQAPGTCFHTLGDSDLEKQIGFETRDACVLEFDFQSPFLRGGDLHMSYVFGSEEYPEKALNSSFNDAFALLLNGVNLATLPGVKKTTVSIQNVNRDTNQEFFNDNDPDYFGIRNVPYPFFQADGFTTRLTAFANAVVNEGKNHLKLVIADGADCFLDSWVLLEESSITFTPPPCEEIPVDPRLEPVSVGTELGGTVVQIQLLVPLYCLGDGDENAILNGTEVYCLFNGSTMEEVVPGLLLVNGDLHRAMIECVSPYAGMPAAAFVSYALHSVSNEEEDPPLDKFQTNWTVAHKEFMFYGGTQGLKAKDNPGLKTSKKILTAEELFTATWENQVLQQNALESINRFIVNDVNVTALDLIVELELLAFDGESFEVADRWAFATDLTDGKVNALLTIPEASIFKYLEDYGSGEMVVAMVRAVASTVDPASGKRRVGATISSGLLGVFSVSASQECSLRRCPFDIASVPTCPTTVNYAILDLGFVNDEACRWGGKDDVDSDNCELFDTDVVEGCFRADGPDLAGQRCCYTAKGALLPDGHYSDVFGAFGPAADCFAPSKYMFLPPLHFAYDVVPFYTCCVFSTSKEDCATYYKHRPSFNSRAISRYEKPTLPGWSWGDPHFRTLDGVDYDFNGAGEYVAFCVKDDDDGASDLQSVLAACNPFVDRLTGRERQALSVHLRFAPVVTGDGDSTVTVGVAIEDPKHYEGKTGIAIVPHPTRRIDVFNGSKIVEFPDMMSQYKNVTTLVFSSGAKVTRSSDLTDDTIEITVTMPSGLVVKIMETAGVMFPSIQVSSRFVGGNGLGILGLFDGNPSNDFMGSTGSIVDLSLAKTEAEKNKKLFDDFGQTWMIWGEKQSLFQGLKGYTESFEKYDNPSYVPDFSPPDKSDRLLRKAQAACGLIQVPSIQKGCVYDIVISSDFDRFKATAELTEREHQGLEVLTNALPRIQSRSPAVTLKRGVKSSFHLSVSDIDSDDLAVSMDRTNDNLKFNFTYNAVTRKGKLFFKGSPSDGVFVAWLSVSDGFNSILSSYTFTVLRKTIKPPKTRCFEILQVKTCKCKVFFKKVKKCVRQRARQYCPNSIPRTPKEKAEFFQNLYRKVFNASVKCNRRDGTLWYNHRD